MAVVLEDKPKEEKPLQYECQCCKAIMDSRDSPPHGNPPICGECWKSRQEFLGKLYNEVERPLSMLMQPEVQLTKQQIDNIRNSLRTNMRRYGYEDLF